MSTQNPPENTNEQDKGNFLQKHFEEKDRFILLLVLLLILSLFMDFQAKRHNKNLKSELLSNTSKNAINELDKEIEIAQKKLDANFSKKNLENEVPIIKNNAKSILEKFNPSYIKNSLKETAIKQQTEAIEEAKTAKASEILNKKNLFTEENSNDLTQTSLTKNNSDYQINNGTQDLNEKSNISKTELNKDIVYHPSKNYKLYFIHFDLNSRNSKIVSVSRNHNGGMLRLTQVLENLKKGPAPNEKGLINNFDHNIQIYSIKIINGVALIDVSPSIGRLKPRIVQDRLEQLTHTLTQFQQVESVTILVNGKRVQSLDNNNIFVSSELKPKKQSYRM